jgi:hypothetical protein
MKGPMRIHSVRFIPLHCGPECVEEGCGRPPYRADGRCKFHSDIALYKTTMAQQGPVDAHVRTKARAR